MKFIRTKVCILFAAVFAIIVSCADDEKVTPSQSSSTEGEGKLIIAPLDPDFIPPAEIENAKATSITVTKLDVFLSRNSQATSGNVRVKLTSVVDNLPVAQSGLIAVNQFPVQGQGSPATIQLPVNRSLNLSTSYRIEVECVDCYTGQVYWTRSATNAYSNGSAEIYAGQWGPVAADFAFRIYNTNSDGAEYVGLYQSQKTNVYVLNANNTRYSQTFKPELGDGYIISIPDANLQQAIRQAAGLNNNASITYGNVRGITTLSAVAVGNLEGIDYLDNLNNLTLSLTGDVSVTPLKVLTKLTTLNLAGDVTNIGQLNTLSALTNLSLQNNVITGIETVAFFTKLTDLSIKANKLTNVDALSSLTKLINLHLESNKLTTVTSLGSLTKLKKLELRTHKLTDISSFTGLTSLTYLQLYATEYHPEQQVEATSNLTNISALSALTKLTYLEITDTKVSDVSALSTLTNLTELRLHENEINNDGVEGIEGLSKLVTLTLNDNKLTSVTSISDGGFTNLVSLNLSDNQLTTGIYTLNKSKLPALDYLSLYNVPLTSQQKATLRVLLPDTQINF